MKMIISLFTFLPFIVFGQVIKPITINSYETTAPTLQYYQANEITIPVYLKNGTNAANITGMTPFFSWSSGTNASGIMTAACAVVNSTQGFFNATFSQESLNANGYFIYEAGAKTNGKPVVYRQGVFQLIRSPYAAGVGPAQLQTNIDFAIYNPVNAPWIESNQVDGVTLVWVAGKLTSQGSEAPDLTARSAIVAETNRAQQAEAQLSANFANYTLTNDQRLVGALTNPAAFDPAGSAAGVSNLLSGYVPTDDPAYLASITGAVYGAQDGPTIAGGVLTVGTNLFGGGTGGTGGGNVASVTGTGGLVNVGLTTGAVFIALSDATTQSLAKADAAVLTTTPGYTNATAHAGSGHGVSADGGFYGGTSPENIGQGGGIGLGAVARYGGAAGWQAVAFDGGAVGDGAASDDGGAVGKSAKAGDGFAGGKNAFATDDGTLTGTRIDAIQLGSGGNTNPLSLQIYGYQLMSSAGFVPVARLNSIPTNALDATADLAYRNLATNTIGASGSGYHALTNDAGVIKWVPFTPGTGGTSTGGVTALQVTNIANAAVTQWATNPATAPPYIDGYNLDFTTGTVRWIVGGYTNRMIMTASNFTFSIQGTNYVFP